MGKNSYGSKKGRPAKKSAAAKKANPFAKKGAAKKAPAKGKKKMPPAMLKRMEMMKAKKKK